MDIQHSDRDVNPQSFHSFLNALKGKTVTIYRGGPESKTGKLLNVKSDYVTLCSENNVIYYQTSHIKSIIEDTKSNSKQHKPKDEKVEFYDAKTFSRLVEKMKGESIKLNQGGPESKHGKLIAVSNDYIVLFTEDDGLVYANLEHLKSISKHNEKQYEGEIPSYVKADCFQDVFSRFSHQWVSINRGGPEAMEGVLVDHKGGHYTLVHNEEVMRIQPYHIKSISCGPKGLLKKVKQGEGSESSEEMENESSNESSSSSQQNTTSSSHKDRGTSSNRFKEETVTKSIDYIWKG